MCPSPESGRDVYYSYIPKKSEWINTSHYIHEPKLGFVGQFGGANIYRPPSTHKRVFKKGRKIRTMAAFDKWVSAGGWIFWGYQRRAVHPGWAMSWQYQMVRNSLGRIWKAVRINA